MKGNNNLPTPSIFSAIQKMQQLLTRQEKITWLVIIVFALITSFLELLTASVIVLFAQVLNQPEVGQKYLSMIGMSNDLSHGSIVFYVSIIVGIVYLIKNIIASVEVFYQNFSIQKMNYNFKNKLLNRYALSDYGFYLTRNSSFGMQVIGGDTELMFASGMIPIASILSEGIIFLTLIGMIVYMNPSLAITIFCLVVLLSFGIIKGLLPRFYRFGQRLQESTRNAYQNLIQFFHAFKEIVLSGEKKSFILAYQRHSYQKSYVQAIQTSLNVLPRMAIEILFVGLFVITISFLCLEHESPLHMIGILGGYLYAGFRLMPGLNRIINQLNIFKSVIPYIEVVHHEYTTITAKENYLDIQAFKFNKNITLYNVSFRYLNTKEDALSNITLEIQKGERIGIIGETGSGKSTLIDVILGLLKPHHGAITVDSKYPVNSYQWHKNIGYVPQSIYLTDDSIEANIAFGETNIDQIRLNEATSAAQLNKFINALPYGYKTIVGERGVRLSGGERQRIAIARALYHNPEVLIFDEATSALDNETEAILMDTINSISQGRTVIMIAHRITTLKNCKRIVVMDNGKIKKITSYNQIQNITLQHEQYTNTSC